MMASSSLSVDQMEKVEKARERRGDGNRRRRLMMRGFGDCGTGRHDHYRRRIRWSSRRRGGIENEREERKKEREAIGR
jgi:hypothetical protein